jgi:hypothetical protein
MWCFAIKTLQNKLQRVPKCSYMPPLIHRKMIFCSCLEQVINMQHELVRWLVNAKQVSLSVNNYGITILLWAASFGYVKNRRLVDIVGYWEVLSDLL